MTEAPVDVTRMTELFGDDREFLNEVYATFIEDSELRVESLAVYVDAQDAAKCAAVAHAIKGASANVGADGVLKFATLLEQESRAGDMSNARSHLDALALEFQKAKAFLDEFLESIKS